MQEEGIALSQYFAQNKDLISSLIKNFGKPSQVSPEAVLLEANKTAQRVSEGFASSFMTQESSVEGIENLQELSRRAQEGASCLILLEHYSNADYPCFHALLTRLGEQELADKLIAMAGVKLYEDTPLTNFMIKAYRSLFVYPSRSIARLGDSEADKAEKERSTKINMASLRKLMEIKRQDNIVALFPAGTRYRPGKPETKQVIREVASYLKQFDYCVFVGINGNILRIVSENMEEDRVTRDTIVFSVSPVTKTSDFIRDALSTFQGEDAEEQKDWICLAVSRELDKMHEIGLQVYHEKSASHPSSEK